MAQAKRKKRFFDVDIPTIGKETQLQAYEVSELAGRFIKYDLTRFLKGKSMLLTSEVEVENDKASASPRKIMLMSYFLKRMIRKGTNYVEDSFSTPCKNAELKIKPFLVTRRKVSRAVRKALREKAREELTNHVKTLDFEQIFDEIIQNKLQRQLSTSLKKIYPLSLCEIRVLEVKKNPEVKE
jgi:ribosomal protein S3AE